MALTGSTTCSLVHVTRTTMAVPSTAQKGIGEPGGIVILPTLALPVTVKLTATSFPLEMLVGFVLM